MFSSRFMLFPTFFKKIGVKKKIGGGGGVEILSHFTFYAIFNTKKNTIEKFPFT